MTGRGVGAISTVEVVGDSALDVIREIFKPAGTKIATFETGQILRGTIVDGTQVVDQVTLGCESAENFAIHCHGNPVIVEMIMELLQKHGAQPVASEQLLAETLAAKGQLDTIAIEARIAQAKARTIEGTKLIANQINGGLAERAQNWLDGIDGVSLNKIKAEAAKILQNSQAAKLIIYGCTAVLTGPPNSGKSTLLNYLAGRKKAIVTDIKGTTRDWVEAECQIAPLSVTLIDTAGIDENNGGASSTLHNATCYEQLTGVEHTIDQAAHERTAEILKISDLVLLVLDQSQSTLELDSGLLGHISEKEAITVLNKSDLPGRLDVARLPHALSEPVRISAKEGMGMENLKEKIRQTSGTSNFDLKQSICFTHRQEEVLGQLTKAESEQQAASIIADLISGRT